MAKIKKQKRLSLTLIAIMIILIIAVVLIAGIEIKPICGNNKCETGETCSSCQQDCGSCPTTTIVEITTTKVPTTTTALTTTAVELTTTTVLPNATTTKIPDSCSDTDGGVKYDVQGTVSGYHLGKPYSHTDFCTSDVLTEYYCLIYYGDKIYNCVYASKKCINGACV